MSQKVEHFTIGVSELHTETLLSRQGDVTLTLRTSSGDGKADGKGDRESGVSDWGDSGVGEGERVSKLRLWVESVLLWPLVRCCEERKKILSATKVKFYTIIVFFFGKYFKCACGRSDEPQ